MVVLTVTEEELKSIVTREVAGNVLYVMEGEGFPPGSFTEALIRAINKADFTNRRKLSVEYPELVIAVNAYMNLDFGRDVLREIMKG